MVEALRSGARSVLARGRTSAGFVIPILSGGGRTREPARRGLCWQCLHSGVSGPNELHGGTLCPAKLSDTA